MRVMGDRIAIDGLVVETNAPYGWSASVRSRRRPGQGRPDAVEIGARVLDREQAGANAEFVKAEFEKAAERHLNGQFADRARPVRGFSTNSIDKVLRARERPPQPSELEKLFSDGSTASVQNRVRELVNPRAHTAHATT